jgi:hypothetical protein
MANPATTTATPNRISMLRPPARLAPALTIGQGRLHATLSIAEPNRAMSFHRARMSIADAPGVQAPAP